MNLSKRLLCIVKKVKQDARIIDIGTDHGYVPIYLYLNHIINKAIASDVSKGSCSKAQMNIDCYKVGNSIEVICSDGLKSIDTEGFDTLMISGMGGPLMNKILHEAGEKLGRIETLILQPQSDIKELRKGLHELGYQISEEEMLYEDKKYYNIIVAEKGKEVYNNEVEYLFGKKLIEKKDQVFKAFLLFELERTKEITNALKRQNTQSINFRLNELADYIKILEETLNNYI